MIDYDRRTIVELEESTPKGDMSLDELLDIVEEFSCSVPETLDISVYMGWGAGFALRATRLESEEEYDERIALAKQAAFEHQDGKNRSWERQKRKFRNARKRRKAKN